MTAPDWSQIVQFEIADLAAAARLTKLLGRRWEAGLLVEDDAAPDESTMVVTHLRDSGGDLAVLLRSVEAWVAEESLLAIRFLVDGCTYVLEAGEPDWASFPLAPVEPEPGIAPTG